MKAVEFTTTPKNGVIKIPKQYLQDISEECHIIILIKEKPSKKKKVKLSALSLDTKNLKFDRDEANER